MRTYLPEGRTYDNKAETPRYTLQELKESMLTGKILESRVLLCDKDHNLHVDLGAARGIIPRCEGAIGIADGSVRDIALISRVNKDVSFCVQEMKKDEYGNVIATLSRRMVQEKCMEDYVSSLRTGDVIDARVTHLEKFGAFVDIGAGINALIPIDMISISRIPHPSERFHENENIRAVVRGIENGKITLSHRELLGTWEENAKLFSPGETVPGIIRSVEHYGVFVELMPNLAGLAEPMPDAKPSQKASVYIKSIIPERMKLKPDMVDGCSAEYLRVANQYFFEGDRMDVWRYSPAQCDKIIETVF
ncbi:MAG: S1 RNA-binding domain-containing protein [Clostridiales bacterium]|nr:S1 RNA-binding domain-containing protein [Clostridiales bacterium]